MSVMALLAKAGLARHTVLQAELPPLSMPIYATLLTGRTPQETGITGNDHPIDCPAPTIFRLASRHGLRTAAAAFFWMAELCNHNAFDAVRDRFTDDPSLPIARGLFYVTEAYPDRECFLDAEALRRTYTPNLLLVHPMGIDFAGHAHGVRSPAYRNAVRNLDDLLGYHLPRWMGEDTCIIVTSDHGMDTEGSHHDATPLARRVPFWMLGSSLPLPTSQREVAPLMAQLLGLPDDAFRDA
jgi:predicted AlkP superfamily pyrophosphatase or phosphodiesterase